MLDSYLVAGVARLGSWVADVIFWDFQQSGRTAHLTHSRGYCYGVRGEPLGRLEGARAVDSFFSAVEAQFDMRGRPLSVVDGRVGRLYVCHRRVVAIWTDLALRGVNRACGCIAHSRGGNVVKGGAQGRGCDFFCCF